MRDLSTPVLNALLAGLLVPRALCLMSFDEGALGFWNDIGNIAWNGDTYYGTGSLGTVSALPGTTEGSVPGFTLSLSGLDTNVLTSFFEKTWHQRAIQIYLVLLDPNTRAFVDDPVLIASGRMDTASIKGGEDKQSVLEISCEDVSRRLSWQNPSVRSNADQLSRSDTDTFMQSVASMAERQIYWGVKQPKPPHALKQKRGISIPIS